jgi:hypothetical protein
VYLNSYTSSTCGGGWAASPATFSTILSLFYTFFKCNLPLKYYGYTIESVPIFISKAPVMFWSVIICVTHSRVEGNTIFLSDSYLTTDIYGSLGKIKLSDHGCIWAYMCWKYKACSEKQKILKEKEHHCWFETYTMLCAWFLLHTVYRRKQREK